MLLLVLGLLLLQPTALHGEEPVPPLEAAEVYTPTLLPPAYTPRAPAAEAQALRLAQRAAASLATLQPLAPHEPQPHLFSRVLSPEEPPLGAALPQRVLVTYAYTDSPCARRNLAHFLRHGLAPTLQDGTPIDYSFVLQGRNPTDIFQAAGVPYHTAYVSPHRQRGPTKREHAPESQGGYDHSAPLVRLYLLDNAHGQDAARNYVCAARRAWEEGWAPHAATARGGAYSYLVLLNGAARGPFLPAFAALLGMNWVDVALHALRSDQPALLDVHAVGTSIDCVSGAAEALAAAAAAAVAAADAAAPAPTSPFPALHLHPTMLALDAMGLAAASAHLHCYHGAADAQWQGVVGLTQGVLGAGSKVLALQGLWGGRPLGLADLHTADTAARCQAAAAAGGDTAAPGAYFKGGTLQPMDAMFVACGHGLTWGEEQELDRLSDFENAFR